MKLLERFYKEVDNLQDPEQIGCYVVGIRVGMAMALLNAEVAEQLLQEIKESTDDNPLFEARMAELLMGDMLWTALLTADHRQ